MKYFIIIFLNSLFWFSFSYFTTVVLANEPTDAIVPIHDDPNDSYGGTGTIIIINDTNIRYFITCAHGQDPNKPWYIFFKDKKVAATLLAFDKRQDLALLTSPELQNRPYYPLARADECPQRGETVWLAGCGPGQFAQFRGTVKQAGRLMSEGSVVTDLVFTGGGRYGDSGGPIFNSAGNKVIGIYYGAAQNEAVGTSCIYIADFLRKHGYAK